MNYIPLYIKTSYSLLSSLCDIKKLIKKCVELGIKSIAITDSNMYGVMEFYKECNNNNIKPIIGFEIIIDGSIILLYAKNYSGYQNMTRLCFIKQNKELNIEDLKLYSNDLICVTDNIDLYKILSDEYENIYLGYKDLEDKILKTNITKDIVYINEILCLESNDIEYLRYLYLIRDGKKIEEKDSYVISDNCFLGCSTNEVYEKEFEISNMCDVVFITNKELLPKYNKDINFNEKDYLFELCKKGLYKRFEGRVTQVYYDRLTYELEVINKMGFNDYFLVVWDFVKYAKKNNILIGSGRGSAAGSLVAYSLGITEVDPIKYNLLFERFLNPERISMPDIDIDFESNNRGNVVDYVIEKYGKKSVVPIITFTTLGGRQVIRDVGRVLNIETKYLDVICKYVGFNATLESAYNDNTNLVKYLKDNNLFDLYNISLKLDGLKRQISTHAAGVIISNLELDSYIPLQKYDDYYISGFSMEYLEELGLLKMDFLGLRNLTLIENVISDINKENVKFSNIPLEDEKTMNIFEHAMTDGIFQFESPGMKNFLKKLKPNTFDDIVAAIALFRPGPADNIESFIKRKYGQEKIDYIHKDLYDILMPTYGIIVYQEQIMQIANVMAKYSFGEADVLRRAMSKKKKSVLESEEEKFIERSIYAGYTRDIAKRVYDLILKFANYGFNKSHSVAYSMIAFKMAYLKVHYSEYFMSALLTNAIGNELKTKEYIDECKKMEINILKPDINLSDYKYKSESVGIRFSLATIKNVGSITCKEIVNVREEGIFTDFFDFVTRTYGRAVNRKTLESLIDADCFSEFGFNHNTLYNSIDQAINYAELSHEIDTSLIEKPIIVVKEEFESSILSQKEISVFGFYLSNHPIIKYKQLYNDLIDTNNITNYFNEFINMVLCIDKIKEINTKDGKKMSFMTCSDEFGTTDIIVFPNMHDSMLDLKINGFIYLTGRVEKRMAKYQIIASRIEKL